ncbi:hypothetical protein QF042_004415 [Pedobacter sp. W3I1]|uniref:hypothetical protein n=1 Tax=Pedobacter sp. W3I1 TaxID=3042291 RepID=UPI002782C4AE|nr:hypothetical protein [Pedobacter sp. W3I1]MDQ0640850.1 hypothetical protein [Pedobacter sp. W3I1]
MKNIILIALALTMLSCRAMYGFEPTFTMGMSESDFKQKNRPELVSATDDGTRIYRTYYARTNYKFFFFQKEKLVRFEKGTYPDDYQLIRYQ